MNNFFLVNKPTWISSFDVIRQMRKKLNIKKMWHTWTLDPLATGILLIATWNYTKLIPYFEKDKKSYIANISLDWTSPSFDSETETNYLSEEEKNKYKEKIKLENIETLLFEKFSWKIFQIPPKYSALKVWWRKAYDLVRQGKTFELNRREATIYHVNIIKYKYPLLILDIEVSAWTYIRSIANDIWEYLWTWWYLTWLERTKVWNLLIKNSVSLEDLNISSSFPVWKIFNKNMFIELSKFNPEEIIKLNNWLDFLFKNSQINKWELFVIDLWMITNIVLYDWEKIFPKRKI